MKILGTGIDLVEVDRFDRAVARWGQRLLSRLFTAKEQAYARGRKTAAQHWAVRFAAKEAVVKALGAPKGLGLEWRDLEITHSAQGQPKVHFHGTLARWKDCQVHLSLTHTEKYAAASALVLAPSGTVLK